MTSSIAVQLTANGQKLVQSTGGYLRTITQQARSAAKEIAGDTAGALQAGFKDGMRGVEREYRANIKSLEDLTRSASLTNGAVKFDRSAHNAELQAARERLELQQRLAVALDRVAAEQSENAVAARIQSAAAAAAIQRTEEEVRALERKAAVLDRLQAELGEYAVSQRRVTTLTGEARQGAQQLSYNFADIASGVASGIPPMQIFAQQGTQVVQALQLMTSSTSGFLGFLAGPWGLALTSAITILGSFAYKLLDSDDAAKKAEKSTYDFTRMLDFRRLSVTEFKDAVDQLTESTKKLIDVQAISVDMQAANAQAGLAKVNGDIEASRKEIERLQRARDGLGAGQRVLDRITGVDSAAAADDLIAKEQAKLKVLLGQQADLQQSSDRARLALVERGIDEAVDKAKGAQAEIERKIAELRQQGIDSRRADSADSLTSIQMRNTLGDRYISDAEYQRRYRDLRQQQQTLRESATSRDTGGRDARVGDMVALIKQLFPNAQITSTTGGKHTKGSDHYAGRAIDFVVPGMMNAAGTEEVYRILKEAGVDIRRNANGTEQFFGPGRGAKKPGDHNSHFHTAWQGSPDPERVADAQKRAAEQAARAAEQLARNVANAGERAAALRSQFDPLPADLDRASNALIDIQQEIAKNQALLSEKGLGADQAEALKAAIADLELTRDKLVPESLSKGLRDDLAAMQEAIEGQQMLIDGRRAEYDRLQDNVELARMLGAESTAQLGTMIRARGITDAQLKAYYDQRDALRAQTIELQRQQEEQQKLLQVVDDVAATAKSAIYDLFDGKGLGAAKNFMRGLFDIQKQIMTEEVFKVVFGNAFEDQKLKILGLDKVDESGRRMASTIDRTIDPIRALGNAAQAAADQLGGIAANDNGLATIKSVGKTTGGNDIVVTAQRTMQQEMRGAISLLGEKVFGPKLAGHLGKAVETGLRGAAYGEAASGVLRSLGVKQSGVGGQLGGALGATLGKEVLGKALGSFAGPLGGIVGGILGGALGGLFKKTPKGAATITSVDEAGVYSGSGKLRGSVTGLASGVQGSLQQIADALGGDTGGFSVSIGQRKKKFTVDPTGRGRTKGSGVLSFATEEEAIMAALRDALADGAIRGITAASQRILQSGKDIDKAIEKASMIESLPKLLKARTNPVAAALDELNDKWDRTVAVLKEGGATAAQFAEAQKLYELERADIMKAANDNLKAFIDSTNFGPNSGLSLRDQSANARKELQPYLDAIAKGDIAGIDRDKYLAAADSYMQITRALNGSGSGYFNTVDELRKATQSLLDQSVNQAKAAEARDPFAEMTAKSTQAAANLLDDQNKLLLQQNQWLQQIAQSGGLGGSFIGGGRNFVNMA